MYIYIDIHMHLALKKMMDTQNRNALKIFLFLVFV